MVSHSMHTSPKYFAIAGTTPPSTLQSPNLSNGSVSSPAAGNGLRSESIAGRLVQGLEPASKVRPVPEARPLRIAVLLNSYRSRFLPAIRGSYQRTIGAVAPDAQLVFYEPANRPGEFPNPDHFDLIVLGGSNVDPRKRHPWIIEVHEFVRRLVRDYQHKKLLGIC